MSGGLSALTTALIMNAARRDHLEKTILPALERGDWVLCDRFADSTRAYQATMGGLDPFVLDDLEVMVVGENQPDLTLILDAPPADLLERRRGRGGATDAFESRDMEFHQSIRAEFLGIADRAPARCRVLDALLPEADLANAAIAAIKHFESEHKGDV